MVSTSFNFQLYWAVVMLGNQNNVLVIVVADSILLTQLLVDGDGTISVAIKKWSSNLFYCTKQGRKMGKLNAYEHLE